MHDYIQALVMEIFVLLDTLYTKLSRAQSASLFILRIDTKLISLLFNHSDHVLFDAYRTKWMHTYLMLTRQNGCIQKCITF